VDEILELAQYKTGLTELGSDYSALIFEGWNCLAKSISDSRTYDASGLQARNLQFLRLIEGHLRFEADLKQYPEIRTVPVVAPMFIVDFGRSGSTFLHNLLAQDENARTPALWELWEPSPPPRPDTYDTDERIAKTNERLEIVRKWTPDILKIHSLAAQRPDECLWIKPHGTHFAMQHLAIEYWEWLKGLDEGGLAALFSYYKLRVQHLQLFCRRGFWLSKSMTHLHYLPVLLDTFPDAKIIRLHRDPLRVLPSTCSLLRSMRFGFQRPNADEATGEFTLDIFVDGMDRMMALDQRCGSGRFVDVDFRDLTDDPIATVRRIYDQLGRCYTSPLDKKINAYLAEFNNQPQHRHEYRLEEFALSEGKVMTRSARYLDWLDARLGKHSVAAAQL